MVVGLIIMSRRMCEMTLMTVQMDGGPFNFVCTFFAANQLVLGLST